MAESRDQILIDFQAFTGIDDFDLCTSILTTNEWNLEKSVNSVMGFAPPEGGFESEAVGPSTASAGSSEDLSVYGMRASPYESMGVHIRPPEHGASDMAAGPSYSSSPLNFSSSRMLNFNVEYRDKNTAVVLPDSETVGRIKEVLETELGVPRDKQELKGLVKRKVDDMTLLRDLYLPKDNNLYLLTPDISNPTISKPPTQEGEGTSQFLGAEKEYTLKITCNDKNTTRTYNLRFDCNKLVRDVKQGIMTLTDVPVRLQCWSGWPRPVTDQDKLFACGLNYPNHELEMSLLCEESSSSDNKPKVTGDEDMEVDSDDDDTGLENYSQEDFDLEEPTTSRRLEPLMKENIGDDRDALTQFTTEFNNRYGEIHPQFFIGSLDEAIHEALTGKAANRKLLAVYLHHDSSIASNVFCSQLLCAEGIVQYLSVNFITWAWDLTSANNASRFFTAATRHFGSLAASQMRNYTPDQLPCLLLISRARATNEVIAAIQGHVTLDEMMTQLIHAVEVFQDQRQADVNEEKDREAREQIKQEQDEAYQESLAADRKKAEAKKEEEAKLREEQKKEIEKQTREEEQKREVEQTKEAISKSVARCVPEEPPAGCQDKVSCLRFRSPAGMITRRFLATNTVGDVLNFLTSRGFHQEDYKVLTTFPRRDITTLNRDDNLESAKLYPQETIILEER